MKVSIIVPVYNTAQWLDRCIDSLVNQTYKNIEIILVDDGSTDNSPQVCNFWQEKDNRLIYIKKENGGQASARNMALDVSTGEYICFVDSDDFVSPCFVEKLLDMCIENNVKSSCCGYTIVDELATADMMPMPSADMNVEVISKYNYFERIYTDKEVYYVVVWNQIYHKSIFENLRFEEGKIHEDEGIIPPIVDQCENLAISYEPLYFYSVRQGSTMKVDYFKSGNMSILEFWQERMDYFESNGWQNLVYLTMKNYLAKCLELYNKIDENTPDGKSYKHLLLQAYKVMLGKLRSYPVKSKKFLLQMEYYNLFPKKFAGIERSEFLFGQK